MKRELTEFQDKPAFRVKTENMASAARRENKENGDCLGRLAPRDPPTTR